MKVSPERLIAAARANGADRINVFKHKQTWPPLCTVQNDNLLASAMQGHVDVYFYSNWCKDSLLAVIEYDGSEILDHEEEEWVVKDLLKAL